MTPEQIIELFNTANETQRKQLTELMSSINVVNRNSDKTEKHAEKNY